MSGASAVHDPAAPPGRATELMAARRDAGWYTYPGTARVLHVATSDWTPACNPRHALLAEFTAQPAAGVPEYQRCGRPGCRIRWPGESSR